MVFPVPGLPVTRMDLPFGKPPSIKGSRPGTPVGTRSICVINFVLANRQQRMADGDELFAVLAIYYLLSACFLLLDFQRLFWPLIRHLLLPKIFDDFSSVSSLLALASPSGRVKLISRTSGSRGSPITKSSSRRSQFSWEPFSKGLRRAITLSFRAISNVLRSSWIFAFRVASNAPTFLSGCGCAFEALAANDCWQTNSNSLTRFLSKAISDLFCSISALRLWRSSCFSASSHCHA